jgi:hypothetical protein
VALAATAAVLAIGAPGAAAAPAASAAPTNGCWLDVVNDWLNHNGKIQGTYAIPCYTQAIQHLNLYPDVRQYSNAADDIQRALLAAIRQDRGNGPGAGPGGSGPNGGGPGGNGPNEPASTNKHTGFLGNFEPSNAQSVPLPLLVLGVLALLLLIAGAATWLIRRVQTRRMTPQPAPAPAWPKRR